ncbi:hypothetical protein QR680_007805 [Steinernema hermaphroditum]|uniref:C2H2-type domain-containing protein n=1 Tax=Steinernema hermaphroditum TaxID=289476 RepID=A0AA39IGH4_9BILA|nr:hypothetical protein QR680_007805 [Steinernema hermaphroditum]
MDNFWALNAFFFSAWIGHHYRSQQLMAANLAQGPPPEALSAPSTSQEEQTPSTPSSPESSLSSGSEKKWRKRPHADPHGGGGGKPFAFRLCPKRFADASNLRVHEKTHSPEKTFQCADCHKRFALSLYLKKHVKRRHHKP